MIIQRIRPLANDHPEDPASCKWSSWGSGPFQMIIQRIWPLANDHPENLASFKWSFRGSGLLQIIIRHPPHPNHLSQDLNSISCTLLEQFALVPVSWGSPYQSLFLRNELEKSLRSVFSWGTNWKRDWDRCSIIYWLSTTKYQHHCYTILALAQPVHGFRGGTGLFLLALDQYRVCVPLYIDKSGDIIKCQRSLAGWQIRGCPYIT